MKKWSRVDPGRKCEQISSSALSTQERPLLVPKMLFPKFPLRDPSEGYACLRSHSTGWSRPTGHTRHSKPKILEQIQMFLVVTHSLGANTPSSAERSTPRARKKDQKFLVLENRYHLTAQSLEEASPKLEYVSPSNRSSSSSNSTPWSFCLCYIKYCTAHCGTSQGRCNKLCGHCVASVALCTCCHFI